MIIQLADKDSRIFHLFSGVKGLVSHGRELRDYLDRERPSVILMSISPGEVDGLEKFLETPFEMNLSDYEIIYGVRLSKYGDVMTPPPIYTEAIQYSVKNGVKVIGIDLPQAEFDQLYTGSMKVSHLLRHSLRKKRILNYDFGDTNEYEFSEYWIRRINSVKGLAKIDSERVKHMLNEILTFASSSYVENHVIVIDHEFYKPLISELENIGWTVKRA